MGSFFLPVLRWEDFREDFFEGIFPVAFVARADEEGRDVRDLSVMNSEYV
jgi:hypothetical protein